MLAVAWVTSVVASFILGYYLKFMRQKIEQLEEVVKQKIDKPVETPEPPSLLIDPDDPVQTAIYEHKKMMERLNEQQ